MVKTAPYCLIHHYIDLYACNEFPEFRDRIHEFTIFFDSLHIHLFRLYDNLILISVVPSYCFKVTLTLVHSCMKAKTNVRELLPFK